MTSLSILSVIALPIQLSELADSQWYRVETNVACPSSEAEDEAANLELLDRLGPVPRPSEEEEYDPGADTIRGGAAIVRALSKARSRREAEEAKHIREERLEPIGEDETIEWDGLRRRMTVSTEEEQLRLVPRLREEEEYEPRADTIRGGAGIIRALRTARTKREAEEAERNRKEQLKPIGEDEIVEWDGLRRRKTVKGSTRRTKTIHPPLGMPHFPDWDDESESDSEVHPGFFRRIGHRMHNSVPLESVQGEKSDSQPHYGLAERPRRPDDEYSDDRADSPGSSLAPPKTHVAGVTRRQFSFQNVFSRKESESDIQTHYGLPGSLRGQDDGYWDTPDDEYSDNQANSQSSNLATSKPPPPGAGSTRRQFSFQNVYLRNKSESATQTHYGLPESLRREDDEYSDTADVLA